MKKVFLSLLILISTKALQAQNDYNNYNNNNGESKGFKKENVFIGGSVSLGFGSGSFGIGANPEIGYSLSRFFDAGVAFNINYNSQKIYDFSPNTGQYEYIGKASDFNYGAGIFVRAYPIPFLFVQLQPEENWIAINQKLNGSDLRIKQTVNATSLIGGVGYSQRVVGQASTFFMIGLDLINDINSPYNDGYGHAQPIIRGGFDVYLHPSRKPKPAGHIL